MRSPERSACTSKAVTKRFDLRRQERRRGNQTAAWTSTTASSIASPIRTPPTPASPLGADGAETPVGQLGGGGGGGARCPVEPAAVGAAVEDQRHPDVEAIAVRLGRRWCHVGSHGHPEGD